MSETRIERQARFAALAEEHYADYLAVHDELVAADKYPFDASFRGRIAGIAHLTDDNPGVQGDEQDGVIYALQQLRSRKAMQTAVDAFIAEGAEPLVMSGGEIKRFAKVMEYGFYVGGHGVRVREDVRIVAIDGRPTYAIPKGKRTNGFMLAGTVLALV